MKGNIERVFELRVPVSRAWRAFTEAKELEAWWAPKVNVYEARKGGAIKYTIPGFGEHTGTVLEIEPLRFIRQEEGPGHIPGTTELAITFEEISTGSRIHIVHSGFGNSEKWLGKRESVAQGWSNCIADLALYVETGVRFNRMFTWQWGTGAGFENTLAGPRVVRIDPMGFAERCGLKLGDVVVKAANAPVFDLSDIWLVCREHAPGGETEFVIIRDGKIVHAAARI